MSDKTYEMLFEQVQKLTPTRRLGMMKLFMATLHAELDRKPDWHLTLKSTYRTLPDDRIDRLPQGSVVKVREVGEPEIGFW